jgi:hypothetical protein
MKLKIILYNIIYMNIVHIILFLIVVFLLNKSLSTEEKLVVNKDFINPSFSFDENNDLKPYDSNFKKAWTEQYADKNTKYHSSSLESEKTDIGKFFSKNNQYIDYKNSKETLPYNCSKEGDEILCKFNDKIEHPPPTLIEDKENNMVLKSIGDDNDIETNIISSKNMVFGKSGHNVWEYKEEKTINGGKYFDDVSGYTAISGVLNIDNFEKETKNYSF